MLSTEIFILMMESHVLREKSKVSQNTVILVIDITTAQSVIEIQ